MKTWRRPPNNFRRICRMVKLQGWGRLISYEAVNIVLEMKLSDPSIVVEHILVEKVLDKITQKF